MNADIRPPAAGHQPSAFDHRPLTPLLLQYRKIKDKYRDAIVLFRLGDFYEMFYEDAVTGSRVLGLTLTSRTHGPTNKVPLAGVPAKAVDSYIAKLVEAGFRVAVCEQMEVPGLTKLIRRDVVEVITPGTALRPTLLQERRNQFLVGIAPGESQFGFAYADISTGEFGVTELTPVALAEEIQKFDPREIVVPRGWDGSKKFAATTVTPLDDYYFTQDFAYEKLVKHFKVANLDGFGLADKPLGIQAAGAVLAYLEESQKMALAHIRRIALYSNADFLLIDRVSRRNLELVERMRDGASEGTLISVLDQTQTPAGARLLRRWVLMPLLDPQRIAERQGAIGDLLAQHLLLSELRTGLSEIGDLERVSSRIACERANARDCGALAEWLNSVPGVRQALSRAKSPRLVALRDRIEDYSGVAGQIAKTLVDEPPLAITDGGMIRDGVSAELDEIRGLSRNAKDWIAQLQETERRRTGIANLKVGYNSVFGYYIEVTKSNLSLAPKSYIRKQTVANGERFITPELKEYESKVLHAEERLKSLEYELFTALRQEIGREVSRLLGLSEVLAELDVLCGLARVAVENNYVCPLVDDSHDLIIREGRHPVVEKLVPEMFVANDTEMGFRGSGGQGFGGKGTRGGEGEVRSQKSKVRSQNAECRIQNAEPLSGDGVHPRSSAVPGSEGAQILLITGPNMAGKSTYLRQVALITVMAQIGSYVPAKSARIGVCDKIFTRIGASDDVSRGVSTFLAEMTETANILNNSTARSLVVLDEVGRGTATFDGLAIAWAVVEYLHQHPVVRPKTLFATHYHELTDIAESLPGVRNYNFTVKESKDTIIFLRRLVSGKSDRSYGIAVGKLAGLPEAVVERAKQVLDDFEKGERVSVQAATSDFFGVREPGPAQPYSETPESNVIAELAALELDGLSPLEALNRLAEWQRRLAADSAR
jgi:DNA mismatch repair protein MutS